MKVLMKRIIKITVAVSLTSSLFVIGSVSAHHSFNMFERDFQQLVVGRVTDWNFNNPHSWLYVEAEDKDGVMQKWGFEGASPVHGVRQGVTGRTFKKGELVRVVMSPMKDGRPAGAMCFVQKENGEITLPGDAACDFNARQKWTSNGWLENGQNLDTH